MEQDRRVALGAIERLPPRFRTSVEEVDELLKKLGPVPVARPAKEATAAVARVRKSSASSYLTAHAALWPFKLNFEDAYASTIQCNDCANTTNGSSRVVQGGSWEGKAR